MGIYDRDYYRDAARRGFGALGPWAVTISLIVINVLVIVADGLLVRAREPTGDEMEQALRAIERGLAYYFGMGPIQRWGYFSTDTAVYGGQVWRFVTFQFLHAGAGHLALNMLGLRRSFDAVPFFWSQHYDVPINYVGHAPAWDEIDIDGDIAARDCAVRYKRGGRVLAVATIYRDVESLSAELLMERAAADH